MPFRVGNYTTEMKMRFATLIDVANKTLSHPELVDDGATDELVLSDLALSRAVGAYFMLNASYKALRSIDNTEPPKIAALSTICFADFRPLRLKNRKAVQSQYSLYANQLMALHWAGVVHEQDLEDEFVAKVGQSGLLRFLKLTRGMKLDALENYRSDMRSVPPRTGRDYDVSLRGDAGLYPSDVSNLSFRRNSDIAVIESLILVFELMWDGKGSLRD